MDKEVVRGLQLLKASENRYNILKLLNESNVLTPTEISKKSRIVVNHVSNFLKELKENNLVECLNENDKRGRLYQVTKLGKKVLELI